MNNGKRKEQVEEKGKNLNSANWACIDCNIVICTRKDRAALFEPPWTRSSRCSCIWRRCFFSEQLRQVSWIVKEAIEAAMQLHWVLHRKIPLQQIRTCKPTSNRKSEMRPQKHRPRPTDSKFACRGFVKHPIKSSSRLSTNLFLARGSPAQSFNVDGGFTEIRQQKINKIQRDEFFDLSQFLPENLKKIVCEVKETNSTQNDTACNKVVMKSFTNLVKNSFDAYLHAGCTAQYDAASFWCIAFAKLSWLCSS